MNPLTGNKTQVFNTGNANVEKLPFFKRIPAPLFSKEYLHYAFQKWSLKSLLGASVCAALWNSYSFEKDSINYAVQKYSYYTFVFAVQKATELVLHSQTGYFALAIEKRYFRFIQYTCEPGAICDKVE